MPFKSKAQAAAMHAAAEGRSTLGIPKKVGEEFISAGHGQKLKRLPKRVKKLHKRGLISDKAMKHMRGD